MKSVKEHVDYWDARYAKQKYNTVLHVDSTKSTKDRMRILSEWDHANPMIEAAIAKHRQIFGPRQDVRLLDFGCGVGRWYPILSSAPNGNPDGAFRYIGVDATKEAVELSRSKYGNHFVRVAPMEPLPFPDNHFHAIFSCTVLQHIVLAEMLAHTVKEIKRVLSDKNGMLFLIENVHTSKPLSHIHFRSAEAYRYLFDLENLAEVGSVVSVGQRHAVMVGKT